MSLIELVCPSGLAGTVRGLKGSELDLFANKDAVRNRKVGNQVLSTCWTKTEDLGPLYGGMRGESAEGSDPYRGSSPGDPAPNWADVLVCDRFYTILKIREATIPNGHLYTPRFRCEGTSACGKHFDQEIDVSALDVYDLPDDSKAGLLEGLNEFTFRVGEAVVVHRLLYGRDELRIEKNMNMTAHELATTSLAARIVRVEQDGDRTEGAELRRWIRDLDYEDWQNVLQGLDKADGGIETEVEIVCPHCGNEMSLDLPLGPDFLTPTRRGRSSGRKARRKSRASS